MQRFNQWIGVEEQLENWSEQPADEGQETAMRFEQRAVLELEIGRQRGFALAAELLEEIRADAARVQKLFKFDVGQLADLFLRVIDAAFLADAGPYLAHDLLDVDVVGANGKISHGVLGALSLHLFLCTNSGACTMQVPRMPTDRASARVPVKAISASAEPTSG